MSCKFGEIIKKPYAAGEMSQTKHLSPNVSPCSANFNGEHFPRVFHVVKPDPPELSAVLTRHSGWQK